MTIHKILKIVQIALFLCFIGFGVGGQIPLSAICLLLFFVVIVVRWVLNDHR